MREPLGDSGGAVLLYPLLALTDRREPLEPDLGARRIHELQERVDLKRMYVSRISVYHTGSAHVTLAHHVCVAQVEKLPKSEVPVPGMRAQVLDEGIEVDGMRPRRLVRDGVPHVRVEPLVVQVRETGQYYGAPVHKYEGKAALA